MPDWNIKTQRGFFQSDWVWRCYALYLCPEPWAQRGEDIFVSRLLRNKARVTAGSPPTIQTSRWVLTRHLSPFSLPACCFWHSLGFFDDTYLQRRRRRVLSRCSRPVFGPVLSQIFLISLSSYCFLARSFSFSEPNTEILPKINYCRHQTSNNTLPQIHVGIFQLVE